MPKASRPIYLRKGEHLKAGDAAILERTRTEFMTAYGDALEAYGLNSKWLMKEGRYRCR